MRRLLLAAAMSFAMSMSLVSLPSASLFTEVQAPFMGLYRGESLFTTEVRVASGDAAIYQKPECLHRLGARQFHPCEAAPSGESLSNMLAQPMGNECTTPRDQCSLPAPQPLHSACYCNGEPGHVTNSRPAQPPQTPSPSDQPPQSPSSQRRGQAGRPPQDGSSGGNRR